MVKIEGKYLHVKNENLVEHFKGLGFPEEWAEPINILPGNLEIKLDGNNVVLTSEFKHGRTYVLVLNEEVEEALPNGLIIHSTATLIENGLLITSRFPNGMIRYYRKMIFSDNDMVMKVSTENPKIREATKFYLRLE